MNTYPAAPDILNAVARYLRSEVLPSLSGEQAFNIRVCISAVDLVRREIETTKDASDYESHSLVEILGHEGPLEALRLEFCDKLATGSLNLEDVRIADFLRNLAINQLMIDQPNYAALADDLAKNREL